MNTLEESTLSYEVVKRWRHEFKCGKEPCENENRG